MAHNVGMLCRADQGAAFQEGLLAQKRNLLK